MISVNTDLNQSLLQVKANQVDYDMSGVPGPANADLAAQFGINKSRYQVHPIVETDHIALNTTAGRVFSSVSLRKAVNEAIDRPALLRVRGAFAGTRTDQILPPGMGGFRDEKIYPIRGSNYAKARQLAGNGCGKVNLWGGNSAAGQTQAQVFEYNLGRIGCNVTLKLFAGFQVFVVAGQKGADFDAMFAAWNQDYSDPYDFLDVLLNGNNIHDSNNNNLAYFDNADINKRLDAANKLSGDPRYKAYGNLDVLITSKYAPWASFDNRNEREFVSARTGGYLFQPANAAADLNTFFLR